MRDLFSSDSREPSREPRVILLDYQCTLCSNGDGRKAWFANPESRFRSFAEWIAREEMREFLIPLFSGKRVILITARKQRWEEPTLSRIREVTGWLPDEWYFNPDDSEPPQHKERIITRFVFPKYGDPEQTPYLALESNAMTRRMYASHHVAAIRVTDPISELPLV